MTGALTRVAAWLRRRWALAVSLAIGALAALASTASIGLLPPHVERQQLDVATAATRILVDGRPSLIGATASRFNYDGFHRAAELYANVAGSPPVLDRVAQRLRIPRDQLTGRVRLTAAVQYIMRDPDAEQRANQLAVADRPYKVELQSDRFRPVLNIYTQAPTARAAEELADGTVAELGRFLRQRAARHGAAVAAGAPFTQLGHARGAVINGKTPPQIVLLTFLTAWLGSLGVLVLVRHGRQGFVAARAAAEAAGADPAPGAAVAATSGRTARRASVPARPRPGVGGDWPHTTRVLPWLIALFMAILWVTPFNAIQLEASLPFDLKLDRMILPVLFAVWILALATKGPGAPRPRLTLIHVGLAIFIGFVSVSIVANATSLNQTLEFDPAFKKLTLLLCYALLFAIIASSVRKAEVAGFMKLMLALSVISALGLIWEYRFHYNVFYDVSSKLLGSVFTVGTVDPTARDDIGRVMTLGPTDHPLEAAGILCMALPIAIVGILESPGRRERLLYGLAACILLAGAIATYRKTALLGPVTVLLTIAYFRRRELLRLAPLGLLSIVAIHALSPGAIGSILVQLHPARLGVATISDRASDYDAVRPDVWSHLAFGRGYGSYDHLSYRILDSEMLSRLVDIGILGVLAFVFLLGSILLAVRGAINARTPGTTGVPLVVAAATTAFFVLTFLFDVTSFPHIPYILFALAGLAAAALTPDEEAERPPVVHRFARRHSTPHRPIARSARSASRP